MPKTRLFDLETNGIKEGSHGVDSIHTIHCLVFKDLDTGRVYRYNNNGTEFSIEQGIKDLLNSNTIIAHNAIKFDVQVIKKLYPLLWAKYTGRVYDTLIFVRSLYPDIGMVDVRRSSFPKKCIGKHSLESWGYRLKCRKGDYSGGWEAWSMDMEDYCVQDVEVLFQLWKKINLNDWSFQSMQIEHKFQEIIYEQEQVGVPFNKKEALITYYKLKTEHDELHKKLVEVIPPHIKESVIVPKTNKPHLGYKKGVPFTKRKEIPFNPGSRIQIIDFLKKKYKWAPTEFTKNDNPSLKGEILENLPYDEAPLLAKYLKIQKILGYIIDGPKSWVKSVESNGRIYGEMNTIGAVTRRCTHRKIANIPRVTSYMGKECRSFFMAPEGKVMVGADASGLELRTLAHYLYPYDNGSYAKVILEADVHTHNQNGAGLPTRDNAKTFIYALIYGGGDGKLGEITSPSASLIKKRARGKELRGTFYQEILGIEELITDVKRKAKIERYLRGIDGGNLHVRHDHAALNTLLQNCGAVIMKQATICFWDMIDVPCEQAIHYHDEYQFFCLPEHAERVGEVAVEAIREAGRVLQLNMPLDGEYKIGANWKETH